MIAQYFIIQLLILLCYLLLSSGDLNLYFPFFSKKMIKFGWKVLVADLSCVLDHLIIINWKIYFQI